MRNIFIGDIHGCYDEFMLLINKLDIQSDDIVYLVGDMINKGPDSYKVLKFIYKNREQYKTILGNHEMWFINWLAGDSPRYKSVLNQKLRDKVTKKPALLKYLKNLPIHIETEDFLMIHGGLIPGKNPSEHTIEEITRLREYRGKPWHSYYQGEKLIIYGHWAVQGLHQTHNTIGLDSGCVYGKELTAYIMEEQKFVTQKALKPYVLIGKTKLQKNLYKIKWHLNLIK